MLMSRDNSRWSGVWDSEVETSSGGMYSQSDGDKFSKDVIDRTRESAHRGGMREQV